MEDDNSEPERTKQHIIPLFAFWLTPLDSESIVLLAIVALLMIASALVSGSEIAFFSFKNEDREEFQNSSDKKERRIYDLLSRPRYLLSTILIANNLFNVGIIMTLFYLLKKHINMEGLSALWKVAIDPILITFLLVLFGEVLPKVYATIRQRSLASTMAGPLLIMRTLFKPISDWLVKSTQVIEKRIEKRSAGLSAEELNMAIDITADEKTSDEDVQMLKSIVQFGDISIKDVMTVRPDVVGINSALHFHDLLQIVRESGYSRFPVFEEDLDNIKGVIYAKDLLAHLNEANNFNWLNLQRNAYFVPETKKIDDLLSEFQTNRTHIAVAVDEYGGTAGIITLEDVLEEIIGDIKDEFDHVRTDAEYEQLSENSYVFEGKTSLFDMCKILDVDFNQFDDAKGESDSLAGLILELAGRIPAVTNQVHFHPFTFTVLEADKKRLKKIKVDIQQ